MQELATRSNALLQFYLEAGKFEAAERDELLAEAGRPRDIPRAEGYTFDYHRFDGDLDNPICRLSVADGLFSLVGQ